MLRGRGLFPWTPGRLRTGTTLSSGVHPLRDPRAWAKNIPHPTNPEPRGSAPKSPPWGRIYIHQQKWGKPPGFLPPSELEGLAQGEEEREDLGGRAGDPQGCGVAGQCRGPAGCQLPALSAGLTSGIKPGAMGGDAGTRLHPAPARPGGDTAPPHPEIWGFFNDSEILGGNSCITGLRGRKDVAAAVPIRVTRTTQLGKLSHGGRVGGCSEGGS